MSSGHDCNLILHLNESSWGAALAASTAAKELLEAHGYLVTQKPTLPHHPLSSPEDIAAFMNDEDGPLHGQGAS